MLLAPVAQLCLRALEPAKTCNGNCATKQCQFEEVLCMAVCGWDGYLRCLWDAVGMRLKPSQLQRYAEHFSLAGCIFLIGENCGTLRRPWTLVFDDRTSTFYLLIDWILLLASCANFTCLSLVTGVHLALESSWCLRDR